MTIKKWETCYWSVYNTTKTYIAFVDNLSRKIFIGWRWHLIADAK